MNKLEHIIFIHSKSVTSFARVFGTSKSELTGDCKLVNPCFKSNDVFDDVETLSFGYKHGSAKTNNMLITHFGFGGKAVGNITTYFENNSIKFNHNSCKITKDGITVNDSDVYECRNDELKSVTIEQDFSKDEYFNLSLEYNLCKFELFEYSKLVRMYVPCTASILLTPQILGFDLL